MDFSVFTAWCVSVRRLSAPAAGSRTAAWVGPRPPPVSPRLCLSAKRSTSSDGVMSHCSRFDAAAPPRCSLFVLLNFIVIIYFQVACKFAAAAAGGDSVSLTSIC